MVSNILWSFIGPVCGHLTGCVVKNNRREVFDSGESINTLESPPVDEPGNEYEAQGGYSLDLLGNIAIIIASWNLAGAIMGWLILIFYHLACA